MQARLRIETPEHAAVVRDELVALEERFRARLAGRAAASRDVAREIVRLRAALTRYSLTREVPDAHDQRA